MISIERPRHIRGTTGFMRSRLPQLLVVCRGGAVFSQPGYKRRMARIAAGRLIPGVCLHVLGNHAVHAVIHTSLEVARKMRLLGHNVADDVQGRVYNAFAIASIAGADSPARRIAKAHTQHLWSSPSPQGPRHRDQFARLRKARPVRSHVSSRDRLGRGSRGRPGRCVRCRRWRRGP